jgi:urease accessory protein
VTLAANGVRAAATVSIDHAGRLHWGQAWPVLLRPTGPAEVHLVHGSGGPLGGDELALDVEVAAGASLTVRSAAATVVQPGPGAEARWGVSAAVGGTFYWTPEPTVVCDRAALSSVLRVDLAAGGCAVIRELVILGRYGQRGGRYTGTLSATVDGTPLLVHTTVLDDGDPGLAGPGGTSGARAVGSLLLAGTPASIPGDPAGDRAGEDRGVRWAWMELEGPGVLLLAVGDPAPVLAVLDAFAPGSEGPAWEPPQR